MLEQVNQTIDFIKSRTNIKPEFGIILGTGLGNLGEQIEVDAAIPYAEIPNFPVSTVVGHKGQLLFGTLAGRQVVALQGRFHFYEGYSMKEVTFPVRVMGKMGIKMLIVSNASGGMNPDFEIGELMILNDHINLMPTNPLMGPNDDDFGPRFPDMSEVYDKDIITKVEDIAQNHKIRVKQGVYASISGPNFETPAEYKYIRIIGADAVGMSTVPEVMVARHMSIPVFAISVITDLGVEGKIVEITHKEVIEAAQAAEPKMTTLIKDLIATYHN